MTDIGRIRKLNEDCYFVNDDFEFLYGIVADGMGGHQAGELASMMMVDIVTNRLANNLTTELDYVEAGEAVRQAFVAANNIIYTYARNHYKVMGMGTTATFSMIYRNKLITAHVGDSRAYIVSENEIRQITRDHSYVAELVARGEISPEMAEHHPKKNYITRAIGAEETVKVDISIKDYNDETVILCSDGLTNYIKDDEMKAVINDNKDLQRAAEALVEIANDRGGRDNITIVALDKTDREGIII